MKTLTFKPLSGGRYRCNQTGELKTQRQILAYVNSFLSNGSVAVGVASGNTHKGQPPKKKKDAAHSSKYRAKHG
ncbi:MAG: hypothetical protein WAW13_03905 [Minisyncoccia bacterium]